MSETATLETYNVRLTGNDISWKNGICSILKTRGEAEREVRKHNTASYTSGQKSTEKNTKVVYKGVLDPDSIRENKLSDGVIANYDLRKDGYNAPATVHRERDELPEEAWFVWRNGGFVIASQYGEIIE